MTRTGSSAAAASAAGQFLLLDHAMGRARDGDRPDRVERGNGRAPGHRDSGSRPASQPMLNRKKIKHAARDDRRERESYCEDID